MYTKSQASTEYDFWCADIETTYVEAQNKSYVWSVRLISPDEEIFKFSSLTPFMEFLSTLHAHRKIYVHNLKFDGSYFVSWLFDNAKHAYNEKLKKFIRKTEEMPTNSFKYLISSKGLWYSVVWKTSRGVIEFLDSLKLAPFSLRECAISFQTEHQKLELDYGKFRMPGYKPLPEEEPYLDNDVLVMRDFLKLYYDEGYNSMTIGSCCMREFRRIVNKYSFFHFDKLFPNLYEISLDPSFGSTNVGQYILKSYCGAFVYVNPYKAGRVIKHSGRTYDINSLYPYVMSSKSGVKYPCMNPKFKKDYKELRKMHGVKFYRFKARFRLKDGFIPFIRIRHDPHYNASKILSTSEVDLGGSLDDSLLDAPEFTMREEEFELFQKHYELKEFKFLDGCCFPELTERLFDVYIDKYFGKKSASKDGKRTLWKLFLNNLYGKFATSIDSSFKVCEKVEGVLKFHTVVEYEKDRPGYIAVGSTVTSAARCYIIGFAQQTYRKDLPGFCYCDTDSLHIDSLEDFGLPVSNEIGDFKIECEWKEAVFLRKKCYIEKIEEDGCDYSLITCAGAPERCKDLLRLSFGELYKHDHGEIVEIPLPQNAVEEDFSLKRRDYSDFCVGLSIPSKLTPRQVINGVHLFYSEFTINDFVYGW